jgi:RNA polymerase sigma-70 factor (ECF subfamily)
MNTTDGNRDHGPGENLTDSAFVSLLTGHQLLLRNFVASLIPAIDVRADILQEINVLLWEKRANFELGTNFKAWAFAVARYVIMNNQKRFRREQRHLTFCSELVEALADQFEELAPEPEARMEALQQCMKRLRVEHQQLLLDCHAERGSIERAAEERSQSAATIRSILLRLRRRLLECIRQRLTQARLAT